MVRRRLRLHEVTHSGPSTRLFWALGLLDFRGAGPGASASFAGPGTVLGAVTDGSSQQAR
jgi:hypothetical protein